jgi:signal transduction histidine kinase
MDAPHGNHGPELDGKVHDLNNVLTAILTFARFVQQDLGKDHPSAPDIAEVIRSAERGAALTRQLLSTSRSPADDLP